MKNSRFIRQCILVILDVLVLFCALMVSGFVVYGDVPCPNKTLCLLIILQIGAMYVSKVYSIKLLDSSLELAVRGLTVLVGSTVFFMGSRSYSLFSVQDFRFYFVYTIFSYCFVMGYRIVYRYIIYKHQKHGGSKNHIFSDVRRTAIVYGAGELGKAIVAQSNKGRLPYNTIGFIDDLPVKKSTLILNRPVCGSLEDLESIIHTHKVEVLIIAITTLSAERMQKAIEIASQNSIEVKIVPSLFEVENSNKKTLDLRTVDYTDLLGRDLIQIDKTPIRRMLENKVVLVTGACGSIGSEICRQVNSYTPKKILLLDIDESGLHDSALRLLDYKSEWSDVIVPILCDIKNKKKLEKIYKEYKPEIVFHAAAYKHVPMIQKYPEEGIRTNIGGSYNVLSLAKKYEVRKVIVISTDKAVNPTNVMGATKRVVELEAAMLNSPKTEMICVRFGNVLGSRGSMLPLFIEEIKAGVPITVTDKKIIRYFMAIPEAVSLVFLAATIGSGGEVMVLDMGKPINIYDFAKRLINVYGSPDKNKIVITGLRPGEKMYEELLANKDNTIPTSNKLIFKATVKGSLPYDDFTKKLVTIYDEEPSLLKEWIHEIVPEFSEQK